MHLLKKTARPIVHQRGLHPLHGVHAVHFAAPNPGPDHRREVHLQDSADRAKSGKILSKYCRRIALWKGSGEIF